MQRHRYPKYWGQIAREIKDAAGWKCQQCGKPCRTPGETWEDFCSYLSPKWIRQAFEEYLNNKTGEKEWIAKPQRFTLTVAHLNHNPADCRPENLKALCAPCHCRMDTKPSARAAQRAVKLEKAGQLSLLTVTPITEP
jgi:hypothetical protein